MPAIVAIDYLGMAFLVGASLVQIVMTSAWYTIAAIGLGRAAPLLAGLMHMGEITTMLVAGITSWRVARRRMRYGTWWVTHLYFYLAVALAFGMIVVTGIGNALYIWMRVRAERWMK